MKGRPRTARRPLQATLSHPRLAQRRPQRRDPGLHWPGRAGPIPRFHPTPASQAFFPMHLHRPRPRHTTHHLPGPAGVYCKLHRIQKGIVDFQNRPVFSCHSHRHLLESVCLSFLCRAVSLPDRRVANPRAAEVPVFVNGIDDTKHTNRQLRYRQSKGNIHLVKTDTRCRAEQRMQQP